MAIGKIITYDPVKGYGFISQENGDKDVFVHARELAKAGINTDLSKLSGLIINYELGLGKNNKQQAINIKLKSI
jgi:CspA family cold shock protein